jgi:hypothetical protein
LAFELNWGNAYVKYNAAFKVATIKRAVEVTEQNNSIAVTELQAKVDTVQSVLSDIKKRHITELSTTQLKYDAIVATLSDTKKKYRKEKQHVAELKHRVVEYQEKLMIEQAKTSAVAGDEAKADIPTTYGEKEIIRLLTVTNTDGTFVIPVRRQEKSMDRECRRIREQHPGTFVLQGVKNHPNSRYNWMWVKRELLASNKISYVQLPYGIKQKRSAYKLSSNMSLGKLKMALQQKNKTRLLEHDENQTVIDSFFGHNTK